MARCGCGNQCSCVIESASDCVTVIGLGTQAVPYTIDLIIDPACPAITCGPAGLCVISSVSVASSDCIALTGDGTAGDPITAVPIIAPAGATANLLVCSDGSDPNFGGPGLGVSCEAVQDCIGQAVNVLAGDCLIYDDVAGSISVLVAPAPNGLECSLGPNPGLIVVPSIDPGNILTFGADGNLYVPSSGVIFDAGGGDCITVTGTGANADPYIIDLEVDPACTLATCGPNGLCVTPTQVTVTDTGEIDLTITGTGNIGDPYVISALLIPTCFAAIVGDGNAPSCVDLAGDGCNSPLVVNLGISGDACNGLQCRGNGLWAEVPAISASTGQGGTCNNANLVNFGGTQQLGPDVCFNLANPNQCRPMAVYLFESADNMIVVRNAGALGIRLELNVNGGGFTSPDEVVVNSGGPGGVSEFQGTDFMRHLITIPPGGNVSVCTHITLVGNALGGGNFTGTIAMCHTANLLGVPI